MKPRRSATISRPTSLLRLALAVSLALATLLTGPSFSQDESEGERQTVIHRLEHVEATRLFPTLGMLGVRYSAQPETNSLIIVGDPDAVRAASSVIKALDQPPAPRPEIEVVVTILDARMKPNGSGDLPDHVARATTRLGELFGYQSYHVLDSVLLKLSDGERGGAEGGYVFEDNRLTYGLAFRARIVEGGPDQEPRSIRFSGLEFHARDYGVARDEGHLRVALQTNVEISEGQTAIVGKAKPVGSPAGNDAALVLVMRVTIDG